MPSASQTLISFASGVITLRCILPDAVKFVAFSDKEQKISYVIRIRHHKVIKLSTQRKHQIVVIKFS